MSGANMVSDSYKLRTWQGVSRYLLHNNFAKLGCQKTYPREEKKLTTTKKPTYFKHRKTLHCPIFLATLLLSIQRPAGCRDGLLRTGVQPSAPTSVISQSCVTTAKTPCPSLRGHCTHMHKHTLSTDTSYF